MFLSNDSLWRVATREVGREGSAPSQGRINDRQGSGNRSGHYS
jgi:hypothetical protein